MKLLLSIDTAVEGASVCLSADGKNIALLTNTEPRESAAWVHPAIQQMLKTENILPTDLAAVAVSAGPGSYTGLRVGLSTAKGLCYALGKPLITINTLQMMAAAALEQNITTDFICPMIDARRMEVFTAVYNRELHEQWASQAVVLQTDTLQELLQQHTITFVGNGSPKFQLITSHAHAIFKSVTVNASHLTVLAYRLLLQQKFADLAYAEPFYGKEFYSPAHNN